MKNLKICPGWIILTIVVVFMWLHRERYVSTPGVVVSNSGSVDSDYDDGNYWRRVHAPFQYDSPESWPFPLQNNASALNVPSVGPMPYPYIDDLGCLK
jgi:hypothetical protein